MPYHHIICLTQILYHIVSSQPILKYSTPAIYATQHILTPVLEFWHTPKLTACPTIYDALTSRVHSVPAHPCQNMSRELRDYALYCAQGKEDWERIDPAYLRYRSSKQPH